MSAEIMRAPKIFYFAYSHNRATGGQKHAYRHVDVLNKHGFTAFIVHFQKDFRLTWFDNSTRTIDENGFRRLFNSATDIVVLPEDLGEKILHIPGKKVVFDKGVYRGNEALGMPTIPSLYPYHSPDIVAILSVSDHNTRHLQFAYPHACVYRVVSGISTSTFVRRPLISKIPQIATVRKGMGVLTTLFHMVNARAAVHINNGLQFKWQIIEGHSERETATLLSDSLLFVFMGIEEGLPRLPLEAVACGCVVVAQRAGPLEECLPNECLFAPGDLVSTAQFVESVMSSYPHDLDRWTGIVERSAQMLAKYSLERQEQSVIAAWEMILRKRARPAAISRTKRDDGECPVDPSP